MKGIQRIQSLIQELDGGALSESISGIYGTDQLSLQIQRYKKLLELHGNTFGVSVAGLFSAPGRIEISGNHTDHNLGRVLTSAIDLDTLGAVTPRHDFTVRILSEGWEPMELDLRDKGVRPEEKGTSAALVRGIAEKLADEDYSIGGFDLSATSRVKPGSGLSSSASFEILIASIFNNLFKDDSAPPLMLARVAQYAENMYYGKPCGLMDQMACTHGGVIAIDFLNPEKPELTKLLVHFKETGYRIMVVDTRADHTGLSEHYAAIAEEMHAVAGLLGKSTCREIRIKELFDESARIRETLGDRAFLRAFHFLEENRRVEEQIRSLQAGDMPTFLRLVNESGRSSSQYLQNISVPGDPRHQSLAVALAMSEKMLEGTGASRVHGGGFAGTILAFVPLDREKRYTAFMERIFGKGAVIPLSIRNTPAGPVG